MWDRHVSKQIMASPYSGGGGGRDGGGYGLPGMVLIEVDTKN